MIYPFGKAPEHLPERAMRVADDLGAEVHNCRDIDGTRQHWISFEIDEAHMGALSIFARAERVLQALAPWRTSTAAGLSVDGPIASCEKHGRVLICPSCRAAEIGAKGGATVTKKRIRQLQKASKRPRPNARKENRPVKQEVKS